MKTYAETQGKKPFNWNEFLNKENKTEEEIRAAQKLSRSWVTCACGNQCDIILRINGGQPVDSALTSFGRVFNFYVNERDWENAKTFLALIESRSAELINQINNP